MTPEQPVFGPPVGRDLHHPQRYTRWAFWGCMLFVLAGVLMLAGFMLMLMRDPRVLQAAENLARCQIHLQEVSGALDRYVQDKGHLPARLDDLYPTYLADKADLRCPADKSGRTGTSYILRPGAVWGKGTAVVVYCPHHPATAIMPGVIPEILQNGEVDREIVPLDRLGRPAPSPNTNSGIKR